MRVVNIVLALALSSLAIGHVLADPGTPGTPGKKCPADNQGTSAQRMQLLPGLSRLDLTADEKAKFAELKKEYGPKLQEIRQAKEAVLTAEQKKARQERARRREGGCAAGKKPGNVRKAVAAAINVTADQKAKIAKLDKAAAVLRAEARVEDPGDSDARAGRRTEAVEAAAPPPPQGRPSQWKPAGAGRTIGPRRKDPG